jgi:ubiquinone biosynthesis protein Coq4
MGAVWDNVDPDSLVSIATCPNVLSQEELIRFGVWAIREIEGWECKDKDRALALIEKHAASELTPEADEERTTANRIAGMLGEDAVPCASPGGASFARLALQYLANAARVDGSREYTIPPAGAVRDALSCTRGALGLGEIPKHFAAWLRAYTTPDLRVTFQHHPSLTSGWRIKAPPEKVQALQTQSLTAPLPSKDDASVDVCEECASKEEEEASAAPPKSLEQLGADYTEAVAAWRAADTALSESVKALAEKTDTTEALEALANTLPEDSRARQIVFDKALRLVLEDRAKQYTIEGASAVHMRRATPAPAEKANAIKDARVLTAEEITKEAEEAFATLQPILPGDRVALTETLGDFTEMLVEGLEGAVVNLHGKDIAVVAFDKRPRPQSVRVDRLRRLPPQPPAGKALEHLPTLKEPSAIKPHDTGRLLPKNGETLAADSRPRLTWEQDKDRPHIWRLVRRSSPTEAEELGEVSDRGSYVLWCVPGQKIRGDTGSVLEGMEEVELFAGVTAEKPDNISNGD